MGLGKAQLHVWLLCAIGNLCSLFARWVMQAEHALRILAMRALQQMNEASYWRTHIAGMNLPAEHITEAWQSAEFYANKVIMEHRNTDR